MRQINIISEDPFANQSGVSGHNQMLCLGKNGEPLLLDTVSYPHAQPSADTLS